MGFAGNPTSGFVVVEALDICPLPPNEREGYLADWTDAHLTLSTIWDRLS